KLNCQTIDTDEPQKSRGQCADSKPQQHKTRRENLRDDENRAQHTPQNPEPLAHVLFRSALRKILHYEPDIRRPLGEPPHEVRIPVFSIRNIDSQVEAVACELVLQVAPDSVEHLKLVLLFA